jgi:hypothetical protein
MTLILPSKISRRGFLQTCGVAAGSAACCGSARSDEPMPGFMPCIDFPIRRSVSNPPYPTPVEQALQLAGTPPSGAPSMPNLSDRSSAPATLQFAPTRGGPARAPARMAALNRWQVSVFNVAFDDSGTEALKAKVLKIANEWAEHTHLEFRRSRDSQAEIRVGFQLLPNRHDSGHWSYVGIESMHTNVPGGGKSMNLAITEHSLDTNRYDRSVVLHEFGHALGCIHEHQSAGRNGIRFDRDKTIAYFRQRYGWGAQQTIDNVLNRYNATDLLRFSDFDGDSIMLYQYDAAITVDNKGSKQNYELSNTDKSFISQLYGVTPVNQDGGGGEQPTPSGLRTITLGGESLRGALTPSEQVNTFAFRLTAPNSCRIRSHGYTQVGMRLYRAATEIPFKPTTPDLVNLEVMVSLSAGEYRLEIRPAYAGGVGEYEVSLKSA